VVAFPAALEESVAAGAARVLVFPQVMCQVAAAIPRVADTASCIQSARSIHAPFYGRGEAAGHSFATGCGVFRLVRKRSA
jgi:hypothetical protein